MQTTKPHAALLASPGMGHLIPVIELGERLVTHHNLQVTVFVVATDHASNGKLSQLINSSIQDYLEIIILPFVNISSIVPPEASLPTQMAVMIHESLPALRSSISAMKFPPTALIVDFFGLEAMAVADEFEMFKYVFIASNAWFLALIIYAPSLDKRTIIDEHVNRRQPLKIPGCSPVRYEDTLEPFQDPSDPMCDGLLQMGIHMSGADGILVNTWENLESKTLEALRDTCKFGRVAKVPVYPIGPLARSVASTVSESKVVLDWLDKQPNESVIYVSFGSGGTLSSKQTMELACGLELSKQRFIWVARPPLDDDQDLLDSYLTAGNVLAGNNLDYLPEGFLSRINNVGLVVPTWAPQAEILAHPSVGGFLTHCGWNSTLQSIVNGVPMIAWPLYAEQKMNATMLTEEIGVAVRSKEMPSECIVKRDEIEILVRRILVDKEGLVVRNKVKALKNSALKATSEGGCSYYSLCKFVKRFLEEPFVYTKK